MLFGQINGSYFAFHIIITKFSNYLNFSISITEKYINLYYKVIIIAGSNAY